MSRHCRLFVVTTSIPKETTPKRHFFYLFEMLFSFPFFCPFLEHQNRTKRVKSWLPQEVITQSFLNLFSTFLQIRNWKCQISLKFLFKIWTVQNSQKMQGSLKKNIILLLRIFYSKDSFILITFYIRFLFTFPNPSLFSITLDLSPPQSLDPKEIWTFLPF